MLPTERAFAEALDAADPLAHYREQFVINDPDRFHIHWFFLIIPSGKRQHDAKTRSARLALHFDDAVMMLHEGLRQREAQAGPAFPTGNERIEDSITDFRRNSRPIIDHLQF